MNRFDYSDAARNEGLRRRSQLTWRTAGVAAVSALALTSVFYHSTPTKSANSATTVQPTAPQAPTPTVTVTVTKKPKAVRHATATMGQSGQSTAQQVPSPAPAPPTSAPAPAPAPPPVPAPAPSPTHTVSGGS